MPTYLWGLRCAGEINSLGGLRRQQYSQKTIREENEATGKLLTEGSGLKGLRGRKERKRGQTGVVVGDITQTMGRMSLCENDLGVWTFTSFG